MIYPYVWHFIKVILAYSTRVNVDFYTICFHIFDTTFKVLFSDHFQVLFLDQDEYFPVHWALICIQTWSELKNSLYINLFISFIFFRSFIFQSELLALQNCWISWGFAVTQRGVVVVVVSLSLHINLGSLCLNPRSCFCIAHLPAEAFASIKVCSILVTELSVLVWLNRKLKVSLRGQMLFWIFIIWNA